MADPPALLQRHAAALVAGALADTRVVLVQGARQVGKSTLVTRLVEMTGAETRTLDDLDLLAAARSDPIGFVDVPGPLIIDEVQRVPDLLLAIKARVDRDPRPGQFLLTGSAQVFSLQSVHDTLPGRVETVQLWPLSQGEIGSGPDRFIDAVFADGPSFAHTSAVTRAEYAARVARGGFPEAQHRSGQRLAAFFDNYTRSLVDRDVRELAEIEHVPQLRALLPMVAARSSSFLNTSALAAQLGVSRPTVARYLALTESVFLTAPIPAWSRSISRRATDRTKVVLVDSGIATNLVGQTAESLLKPTAPYGPLLEGFVAMELARQRTWTTVSVEISHYRTKDGTEVDLVLEDRLGRVVGIEVKAASTVGESDFRGLRHLQNRIGADFVSGIVLYTGTRTLRFGHGMLAVPVAALWETSD